MRRLRSLPGCVLSFALAACFSPTGSVFTSVSSSSGGELTTTEPIALTEAEATGTSAAAGTSTTAATSSTGALTEPITSGTSSGEPSTGADASSSSGDVGVCGNAALEGDEQCDLGPLNGDDAACTLECELAACGDDKLCTQCRDFEECDDGNLTPGDGCGATCLEEVKYVFVTSTRYGASFGGLAGADQVCGMHALGKFHPSRTFVAWLSTGAVSAKSRVEATTFAYVDRDGNAIAASFGDLLDGSLLEPIVRDENGDPVVAGDNCSADSAVWTGTNELGDPAAEHCGDWVVPNLAAQVGNPTRADQRWTKDCVLGCTTGPMRLYCIEKG